MFEHYRSELCQLLLIEPGGAAVQVKLGLEEYAGCQLLLIEPGGAARSSGWRSTPRRSVSCF